MRHFAALILPDLGVFDLLALSESENDKCMFSSVNWGMNYKILLFPCAYFFFS